MPVSRLPARRAPRLRATPVALGLAASLLGAGCGKKGPPQPPVRILPRPAQNMRVHQVGTDIVVEASLSLSRSDGTPLGPNATVRILRMPPTATLRPGMVSPRYLVATFQKEAKLVGALTGSALQQAAPDGHLAFRDSEALTEPGAAKGGHFMYGIQVIDERGQRSLMTVPIDIEATEPPATPVRLTLETAEGEVRLAWESGDPDRKGELYNVYRRTAAQAGEPRVPLNSTPIPDHAYVDKSFEYGETYRYTVRALPSPPPPLRESPPTAEVEVRPLDVYPPKAPTGLAAAVEGPVIRLYWFPNSEPDLHGYRVYRRAGNGPWVLLGEVGAAETSFADTSAGPGVRYHYAVTAVDGAGPPNESPRSEEQSEMRPAGEGAGPEGAPPGRRP